MVTHSLLACYLGLKKGAGPFSKQPFPLVRGPRWRQSPLPLADNRLSASPGTASLALSSFRCTTPSGSRPGCRGAGPSPAGQEGTAPCPWTNWPLLPQEQRWGWRWVLGPDLRILKLWDDYCSFKEGAHVEEMVTGAAWSVGGGGPTKDDRGFLGSR